MTVLQRIRAGRLCVVAAAVALVAGVAGVQAASGSPARAAVSAPAPHIIKAPVLSGDPKDGHTLSVTPGMWTEQGLKFSYIWYRSGSVLPTVTGASFTLTGWDVGKSITVRVRATRASGGSALAETKSLGPVQKPDPSFGATSAEVLRKIGPGGFPRGVFYAENINAPYGQCTIELLTSPSAQDTSWVNYSSGQTFVDTTNPKYTYVNVGGCTPWIIASSAGPAQSSISHDGTYLVRSQLAAGVYQARTPKTPTCEWAILSGANSDQIVSNGYTTTSKVVTVTVKSSDYAFESEQCGSWKKVG